jgi:hypothetical protein
MLAREASSLLHYLTGAWPWTDPTTLTRLQALQGEQAVLIRRLGDFLLRRKTIPAPSSFPEEFTTLHFVGLDHLLPRLVSYQQWLLQHNEADAAAVHDADLIPLSDQVVAMDRRHLEELERIAFEQASTRHASTLR